MKETGPRQLTIALADSPSGGGETEPSDASERRGFLLQRARGKKTRGPATGVADSSRLLEEVACEANLATALLKVVRNKGAPGVDGQTVEAAEAKAPSIIAALRRDLLAGCYRPGDVRGYGCRSPEAGNGGLAFRTWWTGWFNRRSSRYWSRSSNRPFIPAVTGSDQTAVPTPPLPKQKDTLRLVVRRWWILTWPNFLTEFTISACWPASLSA